jgi:hypothetical protein
LDRQLVVAPSALVRIPDVDLEIPPSKGSKYEICFCCTVVFCQNKFCLTISKDEATYNGYLTKKFCMGPGSKQEIA